MSRQVILNFHGLGEPPAWVDDDERPYWISAALFEEMVSRTDGRDDVLLTFDDGNRSDLEIAAPILQAHGRTAWIYVLSGRLQMPGYLTPGDVKALQAMGMPIGLHGRNHVDWRKIGAEALAEETILARRQLQDITGTAIDTVSIPFGAYNRALLKHLEKQGFTVIFTTDGGAADDQQRIRARTSIRSDMSAKDIDQVIAGRLPLARLARRAASSFAKRHLI